MRLESYISTNSCVQCPYMGIGSPHLYLLLQPAPPAERSGWCLLPLLVQFSGQGPARNEGQHLTPLLTSLKELLLLEKMVKMSLDDG